MSDDDDDQPIETLAQLRDAGPPDSVSARIAAGAEARSKRRRVWWPWAISGAIAAVLFFAVQTPPPQPAPVPVAEAPGGSVPVAEATPSVETPEPPAPPTQPAERIIAAGPHRVVADGASAVTIVSPTLGVTNIDLTGRARFEVEPLGDAGRFVVKTAHVRVEVVGTVFTVDAGDACTTVSVTRGVVRVFHGQLVQLTAGARQVFCGVGPTPPAGELAELHLALTWIADGRNLDGAAKRLERYAARTPEGALLEEALFHLALVRARQGQRAAAIDVGHRFLRRFPKSRRAARLRRALPEL